MTGAAVSIDNVSKKFRLYHERKQNLKEILAQRRRSRFDEIWALRDVSINIESGSTYGLIGPNGSGKSTLLKLIAGIYQPTSGNVTARGRVASLLELGAGFHPDLTGRENVFLNGSILGLTRKRVKSVLDEIVSFSDLEQFIDSPVKVYSSGMYVRLAFSVAVHLEPEILLVDEVLAVGDEEFQRRCLDHIYKLRRSGVTIVFVSHSLPEVQTLCDHAAWLERGILIADGAAAAVTTEYLNKVNAAEKSRLEAEPGHDASGPVSVKEDIQITSVEFLDEEGTSTLAAVTGGGLMIRVHYSARSRVENPVFRIALHEQNGAHLATTDTRHPHIEVGAVEGAGFIDYQIDRVPLLAGTYLVTPSILDESATHTLDRREGGYMLHVQPASDSLRSGLLDIGGRWTQPTLHSEELIRRSGSA